MSLDLGKIDVEDFLDALEIRNVSVGAQEAIFSCPFPNHANGDENPSASMNVETTAFFCQGCKERGNAITFTAAVLSVSPLEAIRLLRQKYDPGAYDPDRVSMVAEIEQIVHGPREQPERPQPQLDEAALDRFRFDWIEAYMEWSQTRDRYLGYLFERGFQPETLEDWEFGYDPISNRCTFAVRDEHGALIGFKGRAYDDRQPKYLVLGDKPGRPPRYGFPCYFPSRICFGAHRLPEGATVVVCEGELNAIAVTERTGRPAVAINGSHFSERHARILRERVERVILFLDDDQAGHNAVWGWTDGHGTYHPGILQRLNAHIPVFLAPPSPHDAAALDGDSIDSLLESAESGLVRSLLI